ncbi:MAG: glycosyltransferase, partial [Candidatus Binatia bacterium]
MNATVVVIPTYNERRNLPRLAERILALEPNFDILVVDDNSPDGTGQVADALAATYPAVQVLHRPGKQGLGPAYIAGFQWALKHGYPYICQMDAGHSHSPDQLPDFLAAVQEYDLVLGSRYVGG